MNLDDQPDNQPDNSPDSLASEIARAADAVEVGDARAMLVSVRAVASKRRRRRNAFVGLAAAATLLVSGVVVAQLVGGDAGDDRIVSAPATEPPATEPVDSAPTDSTSAATNPVSTDSRVAPSAEPNLDPNGAGVVGGDPVPVQLVPSVAGDVFDPAFEGSDEAPQHELYPWRDGVIAIRTAFAPQPLPAELPPDIAEAFPPEVQDLFPDGLPGTIEEATQVLQEADMLDVVTEILSENPEVSDAIYSQPTVEPTRTVRFSTDGVDWTDLDASFPAGVDLWNGASSDGERFAFAQPISTAEDPASDVADGAFPPVPDAIEIHSSTDLLEWSVQTIPVPEPSVPVDPAFDRYVYVHGMAITDAGYVVSFEESVDFDVVSLLEPEVQERANDGGVSYSQGDEGVTIELYEPSGAGEVDEIVETLTFTWTELGIVGPPPLDAANRMYRYAGTWDGAPPVRSDSASGWSDVRAVGDVFVDLGPSAQWSTDGIDWLPIESPDGEAVAAVVETDSGVVVRTSARNGESATYVGDLVTGEWVPVDTSEIPDRAQVERAGSGALLLADYGDEAFFDPYADAVGSREFAEVDGYRYELERTWGPGGSGDGESVEYRLTDLATGEVVVSETIADQSPEEPFEYLEFQSGFGDGFRIDDPETGEPLVTISYADVTQEIINPDGSVVDTSTIDFPESSGPISPDYWVLGSVDDGVIVQRLELGGEEANDYPVSVVGLDDVVLVARSNGSITRVTAA